MTDLWLQHRYAIAGVWELTIVEVWDSEGPDRHIIARPNGDSPLGRSVITPQGFPSAHNVNPDTLDRCKDLSLSEATDSQLAEIPGSISMYCGPLQIFEDPDGNLQLEIHVQAASDPQRVGSIQKRALTYTQRYGKATMLLKPI